MKSQYIAIIRQQEKMIKELENRVLLYFLAGLSVGIFLTLLVLILNIKK
jgi:hypothetical protein